MSIKRKRKAEFTDLAPSERVNFGNGVGSSAFPIWMRWIITRRADWYFSDASWRWHDFDYVRGGSERDRIIADWNFFKAMIRDAVSQPWGVLVVWRVVFAMGASVLFFLAVLLGGWTSFNYQRGYASLDEIRAWDRRIKEGCYEQ